MKCTVTISRCSDDTIRIAIKDEASRIEFTEVSMSPEAFGNAVTGLACQDGELRVRCLEYVGKCRVTEQREILCPLDTYDREELVQWLEENAQEEGWLLSTYLGSHGSVHRAAGGMRLRYSVIKYVED